MFAIQTLKTAHVKIKHVNDEQPLSSRIRQRLQSGQFQFTHPQTNYKNLSQIKLHEHSCDLKRKNQKCI